MRRWSSLCHQPRHDSSTDPRERPRGTRRPSLSHAWGHRRRRTAGIVALSQLQVRLTSASVTLRDAPRPSRNGPAGPTMPAGTSAAVRARIRAAERSWRDTGGAPRPGFHGARQIPFPSTHRLAGSTNADDCSESAEGRSMRDKEPCCQRTGAALGSMASQGAPRVARHKPSGPYERYRHRSSSHDGASGDADVPAPQGRRTPRVVGTW